MTVVLREPFANTNAWTSVSSFFTIVAEGRTGTGARVEAGAGAHFLIPVASQSEWLVFGLAVKIQGPFVTAAGHQLAFLLDNAGVTNHNYLFVSDAGALQFFRTSGSALLATSAVGTIPVDAWTYIEVRCRLHDTAGAVTLRVNGIQVANVVNVDTRGGGNPTYGDLQLYGGAFTGQLHYYDDLYIATGSGEGFQGDHAIAPITEARSARQSLRTAFDEPAPKNWYRSARQSLRVGFDAPVTKDWYRSAAQSVRVAFQGATTSLRAGGVHLRALVKPTGGNLLLGYLNVRALVRGTGGNLRLGYTNTRVLSRPIGGKALVGGVRLQMLQPRMPPYAKFWNGTEYISGPVRTWNGTTFVAAIGVKVRSGTVWVDAV